MTYGKTIIVHIKSNTNYNLQRSEIQMNVKKIVGYIASVVIGIGFIIMSISNTLHNDIASILQAILGLIFIILGIKKVIELRKQ